MKTYLHNRNHSCDFRILGKAWIYKRVMAVMVLAVMVAGTSLQAAASDPVKSRGNIRFENGTPEDPSDDVFFCAEDLRVLNDKVGELITAVTEGKKRIAEVAVRKGVAAGAVSDVPTFEELCRAVESIGTGGTAVRADILAGKTVYDGTVYTAGTMPDKAGATLPASVSVSNTAGIISIPANGYYTTDSKLTFDISNAVKLNGNASAASVLAGSTFYSNSLTRQTGAMPDNGALNGNLNCGESKTIPAGYTSGGTVTANPLAGQTVGTATADNIAKGQTAWVNGKLVTGTGKDIDDSYKKGMDDSGMKVIEVGTYTGDTTVRITMYPDYRNLTENDFYIVAEGISIQCNSINLNFFQDYSITKSYDPSTGTLSISNAQLHLDYTDVGGDLHEGKIAIKYRVLIIR